MAVPTDGHNSQGFQIKTMLHTHSFARRAFITQIKSACSSTGNSIRGINIIYFILALRKTDTPIIF